VDFKLLGSVVEIQLTNITCSFYSEDKLYGQSVLSVVVLT